VYNEAKDKAYVYYEWYAIIVNASHAIYGIRITTANTGDAKQFNSFDRAGISS
jgi:hypothetical protein